MTFRSTFPAGEHRYLWYPLLNGGRGPEIDFEAALRAREALITSIRHFRISHPGLPVYLLGFSQGAALALITALTEPGEIAGVLCFSGRFPSEFLNSLPSEASALETRFWVSHGREDAAIPIAYGRAVNALLGRFEVSHIYREFQAGHEITQPMIGEAKRWLEEQAEAGGGR